MCFKGFLGLCFNSCIYISDVKSNALCLSIFLVCALIPASSFHVLSFNISCLFPVPFIYDDCVLMLLF